MAEREAGLDETLCLLDHRLGLEIAISVDLARRDSGHRGVDWLGIELRAGKR